ncbi:MAG: endonuclease III [Clostridiales bacterium]|nr:endonuclease III [Clostridiales bacterium]
MPTKKAVAEIIALLENEYSDGICSLEYEKPHEFLFSVRLAAQCTDVRVNMVTPALFERFPTLEAFASADEIEVQEYIRTCGFFRAKAHDIVAAAQMLLSEFNGIVPDNMDDLLRLPGVGRKTANLILGDVYKVPSSVVVDTHCIRISNRLGLVDTKDPPKIEAVLRKLLPPDKSNDFCHRIVLHGRAVCTARKPKCTQCVLLPHCKYGKSVQ